MRDRDLADVDVSGPGCWERESNADFELLKERELEVLRTMAQEDTLSRGSFEASICTGESNSTPLSHGSAPAPDDTSRSADEKRKQLREARRARRAERDAQVARVGWRGFKWEEGPSGEGFPKGFCGTRPGALTEKGIKNVMQMVSSRCMEELADNAVPVLVCSAISDPAELPARAVPTDPRGSARSTAYRTLH